LHRGGSGSTPGISTYFIVRLRSVSGKHAPIVRPSVLVSNPAGGFSPTPVAQWTERCPATAAAAGSTQPGVLPLPRGCSSDARAPGFHPGEARSIRVVRSLKARGVTQRARRALTSSGPRCESWPACSSCRSSRAEASSVIYGKNGLGRAVRFRASDCTPRPRRHPSCCGPSLPVCTTTTAAATL
jgi:hypothetical protein